MPTPSQFPVKPTPLAQRLAARVRELRTDAQISVTELALASALPPYVITQIEDEKGDAVGIQAIARLAKAFDVPPEALVAESLERCDFFRRLSELGPLQQAACVDAVKQITNGARQAAHP